MGLFFVSPVLLLIIVAVTVNAVNRNMNGAYVVTSGANQNVNFNTDYASKGNEYFDVWAPEIATHYGDVFWTDQGILPLPAHIIKRFAGKVIAITGYEQDQVMVQPPGSPGLNPAQDVSVPINWAYNHHYMAWMTGNYSTMVEVPATDLNSDTGDEGAGHLWYPHGLATKWVARALPSAQLRSDPSIPVSQMFSEGNGGESRKSFHGYPDGYAQLLQSPQSWTLIPMQIDTRNRECGATIADLHNCTQFVAGPEPRQARYGRGIPSAGTNVSGLLECPCNGRFGGDPLFYGDSTQTKHAIHDYMALQARACADGEAITAAQVCFDAVTALLNVSHGGSVVNATVTEPISTPVGCTVAATKAGASYAVTYNRAPHSEQPCSVSPLMSGRAVLESSTLNVSIALALDTAAGIVNITLSGPSTVWFGVGFNARAMADEPYTLVVNESGVMEQKIGTCGSEAQHCPGTTLAPSLRLLSMTVSGDGRVRTAVVQRALLGRTADYYSFVPSAAASIALITAVGASQTFAYHVAHLPTSITLVAATGDTCVCDVGGAHSEICESDGTQCTQFVKNCVAAPAGSLLEQSNPTCNSRQYSGGLSCCIHKHNLLDADQEIPAALLRYHLKFRFWFQEYSADILRPSHVNLPRIYQQTEANAGEYDVPPAYPLPGLPVVGYPADWPLNETTPGTSCTGTQCPNGPDCACVHSIHYRWIESADRPLRLIYAGGHCHAPACISIVLTRNDTGEVLCEQLPIYGEGDVYRNKFDESGYLALPPCLWGNDTGLNPSVLLPAGTPLLSVKKNWNTDMGHFGEMASWQMRGVYF